jgi:hypothetical protein
MAAWQGHGRLLVGGDGKWGQGQLRVIARPVPYAGQGMVGIDPDSTAAALVL